MERCWSLTRPGLDVETSACLWGVSTVIIGGTVPDNRWDEEAAEDRAFEGAIAKILSYVTLNHFAGRWESFKMCASEECCKVFCDRAEESCSSLVSPELR